MKPLEQGRRTPDTAFNQVEQKRKAEDAFKKAYIASVEGTLIFPIVGALIGSVEVIIGGLTVATFEVGRNGLPVIRDAFRRLINS